MTVMCLMLGKLIDNSIPESMNTVLTRRNANTQSIITNHRVNFNHEFNWENVQILDQELFLNKRLISEMLFIKRQQNSLNLQTDTERLPEMYSTIINNLSKI